MSAPVTTQQGEPIWLTWTLAKQAALLTWAYCTELRGAPTFYRLATANVMVDIVNTPDPTIGTDVFDVEICKDYIPTGRRFSSDLMSAGSAGRGSLGPIRLKPGNINMYASQRIGTLAAWTFMTKFARA